MLSIITDPLLLKEKLGNSENISEFYSFFSCAFCKSHIAKNDSKCLSFMKFIINSSGEKIEQCPYGYYVYKDYFSSFFINGIVSDKCNIPTLKYRSRHIYKEKFIVHNHEILFEKIKTYVQCQYLFDTINLITHDIGGALKYLNNLAAIQKDKYINNNSKVKCLLFYNNISEKITYLLEKYKEKISFDIATDYKKIFADLQESIRAVKNIIIVGENNAKTIRENLNKKHDEAYKYCPEYTCFEGFSLLLSLLKRDIITYSSSTYKQKIKDLKVYGMIEKIKRITTKKAEISKVSIESIKCDCKSKTIKTIDEVYLAVFTIIDNAIKYCKKHDKIFISVQDLGDDFVVVNVSNKSDFLSKEDVNRVFDMGYRGTNGNGKDGSGLGLFLVQKIMNSANSYVGANYDSASSIFTISMKIRNIRNIK